MLSVNGLKKAREFPSSRLRSELWGAIGRQCMGQSIPECDERPAPGRRLALREPQFTAEALQILLDRAGVVPIER